MLILDSDFRKQGEGKIRIYYNMHFLVALDSKAAAKRVLLHFLTQEISILEQRHAEL